MEKIHGFRLRELVLLTSPSGVGKSTVTSFFADAFIQQTDDKVAMIYLEETNKETLQRMVASKLKVNYLKFKDKPLECGVTEEEIKAYNVIKTIMAMSSKFKNTDLDRISYRDLKGSFLVLFDDNQKKKICSLILKENSKVIEIDGNKHQLEDAGIASITKLKKDLVESALKHV